MTPFAIIYLSTEDQGLIPALLEEINREFGEELVLSPSSGKTNSLEIPPGDLLLLKPDLAHWEWLKLLLLNRGLSRPLPVVLFSPQVHGPFESALVTEDPSVAVFNDLDGLREYLQEVLNQRRGAGKTILFVDDDENVLKSFKRSLRNSPWRILTTSSGEQAILMVNRERVDLVVTDIKMPDMHGFTLISKIRKENLILPIIVCSAYPGLRQEADLCLYNVAAFMEKPVNMQMLEQRIKELVG